MFINALNRILTKKKRNTHLGERVRAYEYKETMVMDIRKFFTKNMNELPPKKVPPVKVQEGNKGVGAGGSKTNENGKKFEQFTSNEMRLISQGFVKTVMNKNKFGYYLSKKDNGREIIFVQQHGLVSFIKNKYDITLARNPDEAYIIIPDEGKVVIKILEKKNQNVEGSVQDKLWAGPIYKDEYIDVLGMNFEVKYAFCLSNWFKSKFENESKYKSLHRIWDKNDIHYFYGEDPDYFEKLDVWIN
jgi:hypothetical protein